MFSCYMANALFSDTCARHLCPRTDCSSQGLQVKGVDSLPFEQHNFFFHQQVMSYVVKYFDYRKETPQFFLSWNAFLQKKNALFLTQIQHNSTKQQTWECSSGTSSPANTGESGFLCAISERNLRFLSTVFAFRVILHQAEPLDHCCTPNKQIRHNTHA